MGWEGEATGGMVASASSLLTRPLSGSARQGRVRDSSIPTDTPGQGVIPSTPFHRGVEEETNIVDTDQRAWLTKTSVKEYLNKLEKLIELSAISESTRTG